jgi:radical SAM protein with 4Fe4S-binding SPASM domain
MRANPFKDVYDVCNSISSKLKYENLADFPRYIDIELTNNCNFRCLMCHTGTYSLKRGRGFMADDVYLNILNEIKEYKTPIRFIRWGEPTLHPKLIEYIIKAKKYGIMCHMNTNGSFMNDDMIQMLIDIPLDSIKFSFQGIDRKSFMEMRNIDFYDELLNIVRKFYVKRGEKEYPYIHIATTITYETKEQVKQFKDEVKDFVDLVTVGRTVLDGLDVNKVKLKKKDKDTIRHLKEQESVIKTYSECPEVFDKLSINWDGTVSACCSDYDKKMIIGTLGKNSLKEIWVSEKMHFYRNMLKDMRHSELELCKSCYDYHSLQTPELQNT